MTIKYLIKKVASWMLALFIVTYLGLSLFPMSSSSGRPCEYFVFQPDKLNFLQRWSYWDGGGYLAIAENGYKTINSYAFFPFYPLVIKIVSYVTFGNYLLSGLFVSWICFFFSLYFLYKLVRLDFDRDIAEKTLNYLLLFPFSFFFLATYTESIYLLLTVSSFYYLRKSAYLKASIFGLFSTATRVAGIGIFPAFIFEIVEKWNTIRSKTVYFLTFIPLGLLSYMSYLYANKGNALYFLYVVNKFWQRDQITHPFKVLMSYVKNFLIHPGNPFTSRDSTIICLEFIFSLVFLYLTIFVWFKIRKSYAVYAFLAWSLPLTTGRTGSMLRYVIILFPCFIALAIIGNRYKNFNKFYLFSSAMLLAVFAISFINGYWIA
jgi:Gpi18-like mannosyltransferase